MITTKKKVAVFKFVFNGAFIQKATTDRFEEKGASKQLL